MGKSAAVRLPMAVIGEARLTIGRQADLRAERGRIVFEPASAPEFSLSDLLAGITPENIHEEEDFGPLRRREAF